MIAVVALPLLFPEVYKTDVTPAILSRVFDARLWRASKSHRIEQRSVPKTSRATVRRSMTQRATRSVTLATLTRDPLSRVSVARLCRRCGIGLKAQTAGCIKMSLRMEVGLSPGDLVLDGDPAPSPKRGGVLPKFSDHVYWGQTAAWIEMPLGAEAGLGLRDIVLDGDPAPLL